ncbi:hypothetical protein PV797_17650 [Clostridiaceae bacterium M8S5]|nr:hypothetical protein PV797_17650 [Clostridiaceae bacterium M8S5]
MRKEFYKVFKELVAIKSDTGTVLEGMSRIIDYFSQNLECCGKYKLSKEYCFDRSVVWVLVMTLSYL